MKPLSRLSALALSLALFSSLPAQAAGTAKDVVIDRVTESALGSESTGTDAMAVSVLLESPNGSLSPRSTDRLFQTGDRFRVKLVASRDAKVSLYNTNPRGETGKQPVWSGELKAGQETVSKRFVLDVSSGVDQLHVVMEPRSTGVFVWLSQWLDGLRSGKSLSKDIQLDVQSTETTSYVVNTAGTGVVSTIQIVHTR